MAIVHNGTRNSIPAAQKPGAYTSPTITTFTDWESSSRLTLSILKETVDEATTAATMSAIFDNGTIGIDKQVLDLVTADYISSNTVTAWADCIALTLNNADTSSGEGTWLKDTAASYTATVLLYVKTV